jgi:N-acyl homoserine lactone hydrolase
MSIKSLQVLYLGNSPIEKGHLVYGGENKIVDTAFLAFVIRTDDSNILVDTGPHPDDIKEVISSRGYKINYKLEDHLPNRLREIGLSMSDINMVIWTHVGFDHNGWISYLHHAEHVMQKIEYQFATQPPSFYRAYHPEKFRHKDIKWRLVEGDTVLMPGLTLLFTPGHTPGHQSVMIDLPKSGTIILSGDAGHFHENFEKELIPNVTVDQMKAFYSVKKLKAWLQIRKAEVFTSHDFDFWRQEMKKAPEAYT